MTLHVVYTQSWRHSRLYRVVRMSLATLHRDVAMCWSCTPVGRVYALVRLSVARSLFAQVLSQTELNKTVSYVSYKNCDITGQENQ